MKKQKVAFITGITGQDGSYLTELLLKKGYEIHGLVRRSSSFNTGRIDHLLFDSRDSRAKVFRQYGDLSDTSSLLHILARTKPDEIYNLAAQSHVRISFDVPEYTADVDGVGTLRLLEAIRTLKLKSKFYQASSSEMFGKVLETPQKETTPFYPRSPYACAKVFAYWITVNYRESYNIFACNGILFNHESPRRGNNFVTKKITRGLVRIKLGKEECLYLGNLEAKRDWGYAPDYVEGMWKMLQAKKPDDYVLATGKTHTVRKFVEETAKYLGFNLIWKGKGLKEIGMDEKTKKTIVRIDPYFFRPAEVELLLGDPSKAKKKLDWEPKTNLKELVRIMVDADLLEESSQKS
jgi:GDPmannose 4,6-dehydratase